MTLAFTPDMSETIATTFITPMIMPSEVSRERTLLARIDANAARTLSRKRLEGTPASRVTPGPASIRCCQRVIRTSTPLWA
jgi:hypothetical protein